jgi:superfamily I DNA and/or RNA helicase
MKDNFLQDIWQIHTDVQEQMLRLRSAPVSIIPESARIVGEKLYLTLDENDKIEKFIDEIASLFQISVSEINLEKGYLYAESCVSQNLRKEQKKQLSERAAANFVKFQPEPVIDGYFKKKNSPISSLTKLLEKSGLDYSFDSKERLQVSINDLNKIESTFNHKGINLFIPEIASVILQLSPNLNYYLSNEFPQVFENNCDNITITNVIITKNKYFSKSIFEILNKEIGLKLTWYKFIFRVKAEVLDTYNPKTCPYELPKLNKDDGSFCFYINVEKDYSDSFILFEEEKFEFNLKYTRLNKFFNSFFGAHNVSFEAIFNYSFDNKKYDSVFLEQIQNSLFENISFSESTMSIGIDFNWKDKQIEEIISELQLMYPFVHFGLFRNHRCNIDFKIQDLSLDEVENLLREKFPSIKTRRNDREGNFYFFQEYQTQEQSMKIREMINSELDEFDTNAFDFGLYEIPNNKEKYIITIDNQSKRESLVTAVKELRGANFCIGKNDFGKLLRVNYPEMIFDISGDNFEQTKQFFESKISSSIEPNLTGDIEKINRLKKSLDNILSGENLQNPNLKDFIFDAEKATKIDDIDFHTNLSSETYQDLDCHLLKKNINAPQKQAIIKTLLAKDLALIQGPPGTGKSTAIAEIIWQHIRKNPKERILLTSETNLAVDNAIDRIVNKWHNLVKPIRIGDEEKLEMEGRQFSLDVMKRWVENGNVEIENDEQDEELLPQKLILQNWIENIQRRIDKNEIDDVPFELWNNLLKSPTKQIRNIFFDNYIKNCNVIGATCSSIGERNTRNNPTSFFKSYCEVFGKINKKTNKNGSQYSDYKGNLVFSTVIQDESSKATPAELSLPLVYGKKNIVIGDNRQLPPLLDKEEFMLSFDFLLDRTENDDDRKKIKQLKSFVNKHFKEMEISHFERLFDKIDDSLKGKFNLQYRMHPDINEVIKQFYIKDGGLDCGLISPVDLGVNDPNMTNWASRFHGIEIDDFISKDNHVIWVDTNTPELLDGTSRINHGEIDAIREVLTKLQQSESFHSYQSFWKNPEDQQIGLISFYGKQIRLLKNLRNEFRDIPIRVSTVDRFQGMERNIIIVSMVRSNRIASDKNQKPDINLYGELGYTEQKDLGFAQSPNRLNVALSRAKRLLIIVGNSELFRQKEIYDNVYKTIASNPNGRIIKYEAK